MLGGGVPEEHRPINHHAVSVLTPILSDEEQRRRGAQGRQWRDGGEDEEGWSS